MCDTVVALSNVTKDGSVLFAKNSDRDPNEAHHVQVIPSANHATGSKVQCTYVELPQVERTNKVLLAKPFWIWGAEMGTNEHGVVIGNEAVFTRIAPGKEPGLIGMDFIRLALERSDNAYDAMMVIVNLLEQYGQSGNCGFSHPLYYDNSYLIADRKNAWVLETAGRQWAAEQVKDARSISNGLTIGNDWDLASADLVKYAVDHKWCKNRDDFHFARCYSDVIYTRFSASYARQQCSTSRLRQQVGQITPAVMMSLLRSHGTPQPQDWSPDKALGGAHICMHAGFGPIRISQSTGSLVSHITDGLTTHWVTMTAAPCTSLFKPVWLDCEDIDFGPLPSGTYDPASIFWQHEQLHRAILKDYQSRLPLLSSERDSLEQEWLREVASIGSMAVTSRGSFSKTCIQQAGEFERDWLERIKQQPLQRQPRIYYHMAWRKFNRAAGLNI